MINSFSSDVGDAVNGIYSNASYDIVIYNENLNDEFIEEINDIEDVENVYISPITYDVTTNNGFDLLYLEGANPKWNTFFSFPMKVNDLQAQKDGQWVVTGAQVTMTVEGQDRSVIHLSDVYFENGKVDKFYVYQRLPASDN